MTGRPDRDIMEEAARELLRLRDEIEKHLPCKVTIHLPPPEGRDRVVVELNCKLR